ncbi:MAG: baseplate assembly protein [Bradyrhizobium icense]|jgi:uncharacterized protein involved in type VI secretion and phage assembly|nr:MAG: baseplate assembly protein [Bradyrhizobium icense]
MSDADLNAALAGAVAGRYFGKYRGTVVSNSDSTNCGCLDVRVPAIFGDKTTITAKPCVPYAGPGVGFYAMPPERAGVWIEFEGGNLNYPIWVGCYWADGQISSADAQPSVKFLRTDKLSIRIDDDSGELIIEVQNGAKLTLSTTDLEAKATTVTQSTDATKTVLNSMQFDVNNGAFTVV